MIIVVPWEVERKVVFSSEKGKTKEAAKGQRGVRGGGGRTAFRRAGDRLPVAWPSRYLVFSSPSARINLYIGIKKRIY